MKTHHITVEQVKKRLTLFVEVLVFEASEKPTSVTYAVGRNAGYGVGDAIEAAVLPSEFITPLLAFVNNLSFDGSNKRLGDLAQTMLKMLDEIV